MAIIEKWKKYLKISNKITPSCSVIALSKMNNSKIEKNTLKSVEKSVNLRHLDLSIADIHLGREFFLTWTWYASVVDMCAVAEV